MLIQQLLVDNAFRHPDKIAFNWVEHEKRMTFTEAVQAMERTAGYLHHLGIRKGERVTIFAHNGLDYVYTMFGCFRLGAIAALVNVKFADALDYYLQDHTPSALVYTHDMRDVVLKAVNTLEKKPVLVCIDEKQDGAESLPELMAANFTPPPDPGDENAIAHLSYTSGTTGLSKGACLAHEPTMRATNCIAERLRLSHRDVSLGPTALSSSFHLVANLMPPLHRGMTVNIMSTWSQESGYEALEKNEVTYFASNATLLTDILAESRKRGRPPKSLRLGLSGGGSVPLVLKKAWRDELKLPLVESYGQSELGGFVGLGLPELLPDDHLAPVGRPLPDKNVRIFDEKGAEVPPGELGEICLAGGFMVGYWNRPEQTAQTLRDGFLHTGDAGTMSVNGLVTMRGRFSELITVAGKTWFPRDIEELLTEQQGVREAAVIGFPDAELGQRPVAFYTGESDLDAETLKKAMSPRTSYNLSVLIIRHLDSFPMTPTGKIAKADLKAAQLR
ncbi:long-chain-fatty-acid--CoA ligase [Spirochaetia bacterium]|nr:long-chain-fatty-acid--CoA ligase [Spirochaetia bacterium]